MNYSVKQPFKSLQRRFAVGDTISEADAPELAPHTIESALAGGLIEAAQAEQPANLPLDRFARGRQPLDTDTE